MFNAGILEMLIRERQSELQRRTARKRLGKNRLIGKMRQGRTREAAQ